MEVANLFSPGFDIKADIENMKFVYGESTFGPDVERRHLDDIRKSLKDPNADGPEILYAIAMDVGKHTDYEDLLKQDLLYGTVMFSKGQIGNEPVRSQGHVHAVSGSCGMSTPEVYEIWSGEAIIYMQEYDQDDPGRCFAVRAKEGDVVIVPPNWAHCTINGSVDKPMVFGAWCVRDYGFEYEGVRAHGGLAYFPIVEDGEIQWTKNELYPVDRSLNILSAREYTEFGIKKGIPIYEQYEHNKELFKFVTQPQVAEKLWKNYTP
ncbi:glucose-6-phosphate isomerase [Priestia megaterium]|nr:glucose-6-phosphate isomerase [Priestia megaterium]